MEERRHGQRRHTRRGQAEEEMEMERSLSGRLLEDTDDEEEDIQILKRELSNISDSSTGKGKVDLSKMGADAAPAAEYSHAHPADRLVLTPEEQWMVEELFMKTDTDGNGTIEFDEIVRLHGFEKDGLFEKIDLDGDGHISRDEFRKYFSHMKHVHGSNTMVLVLKYLTMNLNASEIGAETMVLPITSMLLTTPEDAKPHPYRAPDSILTDGDRTKLRALFDVIDADGNGLVTLDELVGILGGAAQGIFDQLDQNKDGNVSPEEWYSYFEALLKSSGTETMEHMLQHFEKSILVQGVVQKLVDETAEVHKLLLAC